MPNLQILGRKLERVLLKIDFKISLEEIIQLDFGLLFNQVKMLVFHADCLKIFKETQSIGSMIDSDSEKVQIQVALRELEWQNSLDECSFKYETGRSKKNLSLKWKKFKLTKEDEGRSLTVRCSTLYKDFNFAPNIKFV